ncbi:GSS [Branchiostoma lanceolatum]|uniref:GSS protein n=1 Tax=Branchiostoma lanceolatum TaxID=7740 RepID=A0A8K0EWR2_BRALA|nr:GSS [Branchiostoma lanceolatum]
MITEVDFKFKLTSTTETITMETLVALTEVIYPPGNNIFGDDIPAALNNMADPKERTAYVVMDRIRPAVVSNYMVRPGRDPALTYMKGDEVVLNQEGGHLLRTKPFSTEDGGVLLAMPCWAARTSSNMFTYCT